jgi:16S rRNA (adenine1518-N6/adenine1519-N6)-dimethyltransferase
MVSPEGRTRSASSAPHPGGHASRRASARTRELGQNFLVDRNVLEVIERLAELEPADVVLEVGGGLGALSRRLAARAGALHVIELDRRLEAPLREALAPFPRAQLHLADATELDLAVLDPPPSKVVANLPYSVAATVILRTIEQLAEARSWVVMVQREVGERLAAGPGERAYGAVSVLAQLACEVRVLRRVSRRVFRPVPNVDSVLLGLRRRAPAAEPALAALVRASFAHRRKPLASSLALALEARAGQAARVAGAGLGAPTPSVLGSPAARQPARAASGGALAALGSPAARERARAALAALGLPADVRAERLSPEQFRELAAALWG